MGRPKKDKISPSISARVPYEFHEELETVKTALQWTESHLIVKLLKYGFEQFAKREPEFFHIVENYKSAHAHEHLEKKRA